MELHEAVGMAMDAGARVFLTAVDRDEGPVGGRAECGKHLCRGDDGSIEMRAPVIFTGAGAGKVVALKVVVDGVTVGEVPLILPVAVDGTFVLQHMWIRKT